MKDFIGKYILGLPTNADGSLNRTFSKVRSYEVNYPYVRRAIVAGALLGAMIAFASRPRVARENIFKKEVVPETSVVKEVKAIDYKSDPLTYIRWKGQQEGYDDYTISKFIRIARAESNLDPMAKSKNSTATGIYQFIHSTFYHYCKGKNVYDFVDNIDCFYKVLEVDGYPKALSHWEASKSVWN